MRSIIPSLVLVMFSSTACGDDAICGTDPEAQATLATSSNSVDVVWEAWRSSPNNDCGETGGPTSLTLEADQVGTDRGLTLCLPRPDKLSATQIELPDTDRVRVIDIFADVDNGTACLASLNRTLEVSGTIGFPGICDDGLHPDGYSLQLDARIPMTITCGADTSEEEMILQGLVQIEATQL